MNVDTFGRRQGVCNLLQPHAGSRASARNQERRVQRTFCANSMAPGASGSAIDCSISVGITTMVVAVPIMIAVVAIFVAIPALMTSGSVPPVGTVKRRDDAATQDDGSGT